MLDKEEQLAEASDPSLGEAEALCPHSANTVAVL